MMAQRATPIKHLKRRRELVEGTVKGGLAIVIMVLLQQHGTDGQWNFCPGGIEKERGNPHAWGAPLTSDRAESRFIPQLVGKSASTPAAAHNDLLPSGCCMHAAKPM